MENARPQAAEIDTSAPFKSVKEAILLFGEKVLAGEIYANQIKQIKRASNNFEGITTTSHIPHHHVGGSKLASLTAELEQTKEKLMTSKKEMEAMSECFNSLLNELHQTREQLKNLKMSKQMTGRHGHELHDHQAHHAAAVSTHDHQLHELDDDHHHPDNAKDVIEIRCMEKSTTLLRPDNNNIDLNTTYNNNVNVHDNDQQPRQLERRPLQKQRCVSFANPPSLAQVMHFDQQKERRGVDDLKAHNVVSGDHDNYLSSGAKINIKKKKKMSTFVPVVLLGGIFNKKKKNLMRMQSERVSYN